MKKWIWLAALVAIALVVYVGIGPYLTVHAIRDAVKARDAAALSEQVDFPALRASIRAQLEERLMRGLNRQAQDDPLANLGARIGQTLVNGVVDNMITPTGLAAMMEGQKIRDRVNDLPPPGAESADPARQPQPLRDASYHYDSPSRFTATVRDEQGQPVVFVLTRHGLRWKLSDVRMP